MCTICQYGKSNKGSSPPTYDCEVCGLVLSFHRPYVARINAEAAATGMPMMRPMFLQFPNDTECQDTGRPLDCWALNIVQSAHGKSDFVCAVPFPCAESVSGQYMFGGEWLVAPVTAENASDWRVYLPPLSASAGQWVYFYNDTAVSQVGWVTIPTPITEFPLFYIRPN